MIDVREIKLSMRYPESRQEDITDAFMRGYTVAVEIGNKAIEKLESENAKLRELVRGLDVCADEDADARTDCPLYDEGEPYRCAKERVKRELGIEVDA